MYVLVTVIFMYIFTKLSKLRNFTLFHVYQYLRIINLYAPYLLYCNHILFSLLQCSIHVRRGVVKGFIPDHCNVNLKFLLMKQKKVRGPVTGSMAKNFALGAQESPWGAPRATKTSPANFCNFLKSFTCVNKWVIKRCLVQSTGTLSLPVNTSNSWQLVC